MQHIKSDTNPFGSKKNAREITKLTKLMNAWVKYWDNYATKFGQACYEFGEMASMSTLAVSVGRIKTAYAVGEYFVPKNGTKSSFGRNDLWVSISNEWFQIEAKQARKIYKNKVNLLKSFSAGKNSLLSQGIRDYSKTTKTCPDRKLRIRSKGESWYVMLLISNFDNSIDINKSDVETIFNGSANIYRDRNVDKSTPFKLMDFSSVVAIVKPNKTSNFPGCIASMTIIGKV